MKIIKRSGTEVIFNIDKILAAVTKANQSVIDNERMSGEQIQEIGKNVEHEPLTDSRGDSGFG